MILTYFGQWNSYLLKSETPWFASKITMDPNVSIKPCVSWLNHLFWPLSYWPLVAKIGPNWPLVVIIGHFCPFSAIFRTIFEFTFVNNALAGTAPPPPIPLLRWTTITEGFELDIEPGVKADLAWPPTEVTTRGWKKEFVFSFAFLHVICMLLAFIFF